MSRSAGKHLRVLSHLRKNEWNKAHAIVMGMRDKLAFRIHGLLHRIEGDLGNADYWYRRASRPPCHDDTREEGLEIARTLSRST